MGSELRRFGNHRLNRLVEIGKSCNRGLVARTGFAFPALSHQHQDAKNLAAGESGRLLQALLALLQRPDILPGGPQDFGVMTRVLGRTQRIQFERLFLGASRLRHVALLVQNGTQKEQIIGIAATQFERPAD